MRRRNSRLATQLRQVPTGVEKYAEILAELDDGLLLAEMTADRTFSRGPRGYPLDTFWRAYVLSFLMDCPSTAALVRQLRDDPRLRRICGFRRLPHVTTFTRSFARMEEYSDLVDECIAELTDRLAEELPGFGEVVAVDSTTVRTHSNPHRTTVSDPEASWTAKTSTKSKTGKDWYFGYKYHAVVDATYGLPITGYTTTASSNDSPELPTLLEQAANTHEWFRPSHVLADRGYDSYANHEDIVDRGAIPIIPLRRNTAKGKGDALHAGSIHTRRGAPTCMGLAEMVYVRTDPHKGHLFRCPEDGCHLKSRKGVLYCQDQIWEKPQENPRLMGTIPRNSDRWKELYGMRQSVERVFKSAKESRRLERHYLRGLEKIGLHASMSFLAFQATAMFNLRFSGHGRLRWMVDPP